MHAYGLPSSSTPRRCLRIVPLLGLLSLLVLAPAARAVPYDDCDARFIAFQGADTYQFSPALPGVLGTVRFYAVLSYQGAAAEQDFGRAFWRLEIRGPVDVTGKVVREAAGVAAIDSSGQATAELTWDGRDRAGRRVPAGTYQYTFRGRFLPRRRPATRTSPASPGSWRPRLRPSR
jgi:hypothetical protein